MIEAVSVDHVLDLFLPSIREHLSSGSQRPFVFAISGLQGAGKSTWAKELTDVLNNTHQLNTRTISLDDFYYDHETLDAIKLLHVHNPLFRTRGQPGTHDQTLAMKFFASLYDVSSADPILLPSFDKSQFNGNGDRVPETQWEIVSRRPPLDVIVFEGWCVGFLPISDKDLERKVAASERDDTNIPTTDPNWSFTTRTLHTYRLEDLRIINNNLSRYCSTFMGPSNFDGLMHLSTNDLENVYAWRLGQEHALREARGSGMSDQEVTEFVRGYMPAYELYLDNLSNRSFFSPESSKIHGKVVLNRARRVVEVRKL